MCQPRDNRYWIACTSPARPRLWRSSVHAVGSERTPFVTGDKLAPCARNTKPFSRGATHSHAEAWARRLCELGVSREALHKSRSRGWGVARVTREGARAAHLRRSIANTDASVPAVRPRVSAC